MKKIISIAICGALTFGLIGCESIIPNTNSTKQDSKQQEETSSNTNTVDGIKFTVNSVSKEPVKGDRTKDNVAAKNGEYFAKGSTNVKASDYEYIVIGLKIENTTNKAIALSKYGWSAEMKDGYKLKDNTISDDLKGQIASNNYVEGQVKVLAEKKLNVKEFKLKYNIIDYTNFDKMLSDAVSGKSESECKSKYPELFKENYAKLNIEVN
ncbi:DUF4352 domain-containing protein [Clostridium saccharobutylicum]|nr:DUF4352 domain-containing protein [Clostridium saccharobutylicum]MBA2906925.1 hypothetical protein [Clostridium saccharobutylicum]MBA8791404.1 hypothetical protein [Clostridium saccharobutylicum]MBA8898138.1 hypothetical protein [Clostridium saccharobutylicum]MBA8980508.1 hypothetical protein [Clostridium saccharobutylicum]MBA8995695.1 hypothetical protein [Clostridium saccharobutylicum]